MPGVSFDQVFEKKIEQVRKFPYNLHQLSLEWLNRNRSRNSSKLVAVGERCFGDPSVLQ